MSLRGAPLPHSWLLATTPLPMGSPSQGDGSCLLKLLISVLSQHLFAFHLLNTYVKFPTLNRLCLKYLYFFFSQPNFDSHGLYPGNSTSKGVFKKIIMDVFKNLRH